MPKLRELLRFGKLLLVNSNFNQLASWNVSLVMPAVKGASFNLHRMKVHMNLNFMMTVNANTYKESQLKILWP